MIASANCNRATFVLDDSAHDEKKRERVEIRCVKCNRRAELFRKVVDERAGRGGTPRARAKGTVRALVEDWLEKTIKPNAN